MFKGSVLREARERAGYTLIGLAEALKEEYGRLIVDYTTISQWEVNPAASPRKANIKRVADFLKIPIEDLYSDTLDEEIEINLDILEMIERIIAIYKRDPNDIRIKKIESILL